MAGSFKSDVLPLFTPMDISHMTGMGVQLDSYKYMSSPAGDSMYAAYANAWHVYGHLTGLEQPQMPMGAPPWTQAQLNTLLSWMTQQPTFQP
ncbi:MAG TPA: hypothetical protein VF883_25295 [Thermoanaerobaculia bacterium]|jgi:hypothetical protein